MNSENKIGQIKKARENGNFAHAKSLAISELEKSNDNDYRLAIMDQMAHIHLDSFLIWLNEMRKIDNSVNKYDTLYGIEHHLRLRPDQLSGYTEYMVKLANLPHEEALEVLEVDRKANILSKDQLHPIIAQDVMSSFLPGKYGDAVFNAFKQVEVAVRKAGYYSDADYGTSLMRAAFHSEDGALTDSNQVDAEKQARSDLFAGAIGSYKNPGSHRNVEITAEESAEEIILASHLLRIVDLLNQSNGGWQEQFANGFVRHLKSRKSPLMDPGVFMGENDRSYPSYIGFNIGKIENLNIRDENAFWLAASTVHDGKIYLKLLMNDSNCYHRLKSQKEKIEHEFGKSLEWEYQASDQQSRIGVDLEVNPLDENRGQWKQHFEEMREKLEKLNEVFQQPIEDALYDDIPF